MSLHRIGDCILTVSQSVHSDIVSYSNRVNRINMEYSWAYATHTAYRTIELTEIFFHFFFWPYPTERIDFRPPASVYSTFEYRGHHFSSHFTRPSNIVPSFRFLRLPVSPFFLAAYLICIYLHLISVCVQVVSCFWVFFRLPFHFIQWIKWMDSLGRDWVGLVVVVVVVEQLYLHMNDNNRKSCDTFPNVFVTLNPLWARKSNACHDAKLKSCIRRVPEQRSNGEHGHRPNNSICNCLIQWFSNRKL